MEFKKMLVLSCIIRLSIRVKTNCYEITLFVISETNTMQILCQNESVKYKFFLLKVKKHKNRTSHFAYHYKGEWEKHNRNRSNKNSTH